jgi:phage gp36-like protein
MGFIQKSDYLSLIKEQNLNLIIEQNDIILENEELTAITTVRNYLFDRYNVADIFNKEGGERDKMLVRHCVHIILYSIYQRIPNSRELPRITKNYDETLTFLEKVADGKIGLDLPRITTESGTATKFRGGSNTKQRKHETS